MAGVLITGAGGFVGSRLTSYLLANGFDVRCAHRTLPNSRPGNAVAIGPVGDGTDWTEALNDRDVVVHLAGYVGARGVPDTHFTEVNDKGTARLVEQARASRIRLIINASTIAVVSGHAAPIPVDDATPAGDFSMYGRSKLAGERHLETFVGGDRHAVSLRPPMLYGDGASGNWKLLSAIAASGLPLPFGQLRNRRNLLAVDNFVHAVAHLIGLDSGLLHSGAYAIADREALSTTEIVQLMRLRMGRSPALFSFPPRVLRMLLTVAGKASAADSLISDLEINSERFRETFGWQQPLTAKQAVLGQGLQASVGTESAK